MIRCWQIARLKARLARGLWVINAPRITLPLGNNPFIIASGSRLNHVCLICQNRNDSSPSASFLQRTRLPAPRWGLRLVYGNHQKESSSEDAKNTLQATEPHGHIEDSLSKMDKHLSGWKPRRKSKKNEMENIKGAEPEAGYKNRKSFATRRQRNESQDESDVFGTLAEKHKYPGIKVSSSSMVESKHIVDPQDLKEQQFLEDYPLPENRMWPNDYGKQMMSLIKERKLKEALEMLFVRMLKEDRVKPNAFVYNILIGGCGRAGYTKMAFKLFTQMRGRGLSVTGPTYTGLFNACANSPWPEDGLARARKLRQTMQDRGWIPNTANYHVMIKAFGQCGDLGTAFELVDEMVKAKHALSSETMNFLLMACVSDTEAGFKHAIEVWRKFLKRHVRPNVYSYNLLLRCMRQCGVGSEAFANELLQPGMKDRSDIRLSAENQQLITSENNFIEKDESTDKVKNESVGDVSLSQAEAEPSLMRRQPSVLSIPNLLYPKFDVGDVVALSNLDSPNSRLMLLGGFRGILQSMVQFKTKPNIKTFSELLLMLSPTLEAEEELLLALDQHGVSPDVDFFNLLIKKRNIRHDFRSAKNVLTLIQQRHLFPDIATFGVLAIGCVRRTDGQRLLLDMQAAAFRPNIQILGALLQNACNQRNWWYLIDILKAAKSNEVKPDTKFLNKVEMLIHETKSAFVAMEKGEVIEDIYQTSEFKESFRIFMLYYKQWAQDMELELPSYPWDAFRPAIKEEEKSNHEAVT